MEIRKELQRAKDLLHRHLKLYKKPTVLAVITSKATLPFIEDQLELNHLNHLGYKCCFVIINEELTSANNIDSEVQVIFPFSNLADQSFYI